MPRNIDESGVVRSEWNFSRSTYIAMEEVRRNLNPGLIRGLTESAGRCIHVKI